MAAEIAAQRRTPTLHDPSLYTNRELSWLEFNQRVLDQAVDDHHPILERLKFLAIVGSNLDEFFMVRVATLRKRQRANLEPVSPSTCTNCFPRSTSSMHISFASSATPTWTFRKIWPATFSSRSTRV
jgi:polyphosphate kinase